ncbi:MAG: lysylphosphatidylglycerol synthase domain-containing protein [Betaproteobacteria bacterium]
MRGRGTLLRSIGTGLWLLAVALVTGWALQTQFSEISLASVLAAFRTQPAPRLMASLGLTALSFLCLAGYDLIGARIVAPKRIPMVVALLAGAAGNAISNTLGFHALTGSVVRAHIYRRRGLTKTEVARIVSLAWLALGLGFVTMFGAAELQRSASGEQSAAPLWVGLSITAGLSMFVAWLAGGPRQISIFGFRQPLPSARMALLQMGIGAVESAAAIGALYILLPLDLSPPFSLFAVGCIAAVALGVLAHAPGGIGVFEASVTAMLAGAGRADLLAALLMYRAIYNLVPFVLSVVTLGLLLPKGIDAISSTADTV